MFMTNYELIYGESKGNSNSFIPKNINQPAPGKEKGKAAENAAKAAKAVVGAHIAAAKFAGGAVSKLSKKAVNYAKSDDTAEKAALAKEKAGTAFAGLKGKASAFAAQRKNVDNSDTNVDDVTEAVNEVTEDNLPDTGTVNNDVEGYSESVSFDELYERSINISDEEEYPDEADEAESSYANDEEEQPAAAELVSPLPDSPAPIQQQSPQRQYSYEEEKKSAIVYVMAGIIAVLLVGGGILGGMLLMKNKDHDDSGSTPGIAAPSVSETTADISSETQNSSTETVTTVSEKPTESVTTSETATVSYSVSDEEFNAAVETFLDSLVSDSLDPISNIQYALFDVNSDGIKELFVTGDHVAGTYTNMYQYTPKKFTVTDIYGEHIKICPDESLIECAEFEGGTVYTYYRISGNTIELEDQFYSYVGQYKHGDVIISESEFNSLLAEKNKLSWLELSYTPFLAQSQNKQTNIPPEYTNYNNIENAPSDMEFFTQSNVIKGKVVTSSTGLNMRTGPGPDFEKMLEIPKDQEVDILGINNDWCYVKWSVLAAGAFQYIDYYGYVNSEYVSTKPNGSSTIINGVTVYSCSKYGRINTRGGNLPSITLDYITGGEWQTLRDSLGNGWHIKATRYCNTMGITWYEIENADDGDYYGWIDGEFIDFN